MSEYCRKLWIYLHNLVSNELNETSERASQPDYIKQKLLPHQQTSLAYALKLEKSKINGILCEKTKDEIQTEKTSDIPKLFTRYGILCDRIGSGKSLTALAIAGAPSPPINHMNILKSNNKSFSISMINETKIEDEVSKTSLIIIPHSVMHQWESYTKNYTSLKYMTIKKKNDITDNIMEKVNGVDIVILSNTMWKYFIIKIPEDFIWNRMFIDEADTIQFSSYGFESMNANFYWLITASWINLAFPQGIYINITVRHPPNVTIPESTIEKVKKMCSKSIHTVYVDGIARTNIVKQLCDYDIINPTVIQSHRIFIKNSDEFIDKSFKFPEVEHYSIVCETPSNLYVVDGSLNGEIMERIHAGDLEGSFELLGIKPETATTINEALTKSLQNDLEKTKQIYNFKKGMEYSSIDAKNKSLEIYENKIKSIESRINAINERLKSPTESKCPICFDNVKSSSLTPCCNNLFCFPCICESLSRSSSCPLCRSKIDNIKSIHVLGDEIIKKETKSKIMSKNDTIIHFIKKNPTAKILLFSGFDATFTNLSNQFDNEDITYAFVKGTNSHINKLIKDFDNGKYKVLFLNARNMGTGLNILSATHVMLYHRMDYSVEDQVIGRAYRIGRTEKLDVVHLLHTNEIDNSHKIVEISNSETIEHV